MGVNDMIAASLGAEFSGPIEVNQALIQSVQWPSGIPTSSVTSYSASGGPSQTWASQSGKVTFDLGYGLTQEGWVFAPLATPAVGGIVRDNWIIHHAGHEDPTAGPIDRAAFFCKRGFPVLLLFMPNMTPTAYPNSQTWTATIPGHGTPSITSHSVMVTQFENAGIPILPLFIDQVFRATTWLNNTHAPGKRVHLVGHSGGGWTSLMAMAFDRRYTVKWISAGASPRSWNDGVDAEQDYERSYWNGTLDLPDIYAMAARYGHGATATSNEHDSALFAASGHHSDIATIISDVNTVLGGHYPGTFDIFIDDQPDHRFSTESMSRCIDQCLLYETYSPVVIDWATVISGATVPDHSDTLSGNPTITLSGDGGIHGDYVSNAWTSSDDPNSTPVFLEIDTAAIKHIDTINVYTLPNDLGSTSAPTLSDLCTTYGLKNYKVQNWNGSTWVDIPGASVTGNDKVWKQFTSLNFTPTTSRFRLYVTAAWTSHAWVVKVGLVGTL